MPVGPSKRKLVEINRQFQIKKIKYYHEFAGPNGYDQSISCYTELGNIYKNANKNDQPIIRVFYIEATTLIDEMKKWRDDRY